MICNIEDMENGSIPLENFMKCIKIQIKSKPRGYLKLINLYFIDARI